MNSAYATEHDHYIIRDIECRRDTEAETVTDYDSGDVGGTEPHKVRTDNVQIPTQSAPCPTCSGSGMVFLGGLLRCPTCHGTGVKA